MILKKLRKVRIPVNRYGCVDCGYVEDWVENENLEILRDEYDKMLRRAEK